MTPDERKALIAEIVEVMNSTKPQLSDEEMQCVRLDSNKRRLWRVIKVLRAPK